MGLWAAFPMATTGTGGHPVAPVLWPGDILNTVVFGFPTPPRPVPSTLSPPAIWGWVGAAASQGDGEGVVGSGCFCHVG